MIDYPLPANHIAPSAGTWPVEPATWCGGVSRVAKGADCKSAGLRLRRFESYLPHQPSLASRATARQAKLRACGEASEGCRAEAQRAKAGSLPRRRCTLWFRRNGIGVMVSARSGIDNASSRHRMSDDHTSNIARCGSGSSRDSRPNCFVMYAAGREEENLLLNRTLRAGRTAI